MNFIKNRFKALAKIVLTVVILLSSFFVSESCYAMEAPVQAPLKGAAGILTYYVDGSEGFVLLGQEVISYLSKTDSPKPEDNAIAILWTDFGGGVDKDDSSYEMAAAREFTEESMNIFYGNAMGSTADVEELIASRLPTLLIHPRHGYKCFLFRVDRMFNPREFEARRNEYIANVVSTTGLSESDLARAEVDKKFREETVEPTLKSYGFNLCALEKHAVAWVSLRELMRALDECSKAKFPDLRKYFKASEPHILGLVEVAPGKKEVKPLPNIVVTTVDGQKIILLPNLVEVLRGEFVPGVDTPAKFKVECDNLKKVKALISQQ